MTTIHALRLQLRRSTNGVSRRRGGTLVNLTSTTYHGLGVGAPCRSEASDGTLVVTDIVLKCLAGAAKILLSSRLSGQRPVPIPAPDDGIVKADEYGQGVHAVVLAHGGQFDKSSWAVQARDLAGAGFRVVAAAPAELIILDGSAHAQFIFDTHRKANGSHTKSCGF